MSVSSVFCWIKTRDMYCTCKRRRRWGRFLRCSYWCIFFIYLRTFYVQTWLLSEIKILFIVTYVLHLFTCGSFLRFY